MHSIRLLWSTRKGQNRAKLGYWVEIIKREHSCSVNSSTGLFSFRVWQGNLRDFPTLGDRKRLKNVSVDIYWGDHSSEATAAYFEHRWHLRVTRVAFPGLIVRINLLVVLYSSYRPSAVVSQLHLLLLEAQTVFDQQLTAWDETIQPQNACGAHTVLYCQADC